MATIYDDLLKVKKEREEAKEGLFKRAARFVLPGFIEEPLLGKKEEEKVEPREKTIYDDLVSKEKRISPDLPVLPLPKWKEVEAEYYTVETSPGIFASFPYPETITRNNMTRVDKELERANTELKELEKKEKAAPLSERILSTFVGPVVKSYRDVANKQLEIRRLEGELKSWEKQSTYEKETKTLFGKAARHVTAGFGDTIFITGRAMQWAGAEELGKGAMELGEQYQRRVIPPVNPEDFTWKSVVDPEWWATNVMRSVPFTLSLIPAALLASSVAGAGAAWLGLGKFATFVLQALGAGTASRTMESSLEAGGTYDDMLRKGATEEEASKAADETFKGNMKLVGLDAAQFALAFTPLKYFGGTGPSKTLARRGFAAGVKIIGVGLSEGGEEAYQDVVQRRASGEEVKIDPRMKESFAIGAIFGVGLGGAGSVYDSFTSRIENEMSPEMKKKFEEDKKKEVDRGASERQAELSALDTLADTPEGQKHIEQVIENLKRIALEIEPLPPRRVKPAEVSARVIDRVLAGEEALRMSQKGRALLRTQLAEQERIGPDVRLEKQVENIVDFILAKPEAQRSAAETEIVNINEELIAEAERIQAEEIPVEPVVEPEVPEKKLGYAELTDSEIAEMDVEEYVELEKKTAREKYATYPPKRIEIIVEKAGETARHNWRVVTERVEPAVKPEVPEKITPEEFAKEYRITPEGEPKVPDLIKVGNLIKTSYEEALYRVEKVTGPYGQHYDPSLAKEVPAPPNYSLVLSDPGAKRTKAGKLPANYSYSYINELVAVGGRILHLFKANTDEVFIVGKAIEKPPVTKPKVEAKPIPAELRPLAKEAEKYDTAEEFANAQIRQYKELEKWAERQVIGGEPPSRYFAGIDTTNKQQLIDFYNQVMEMEVEVEVEPIKLPEGTFEKWDKEMEESKDNLIEPETDEEYQEGFEAEGKEKAVFDDQSQVFHSTETKTETPDPETRDRVSALKEPRSQLGYVYHLIRTNQIIPEDLRWIVDERNNFSQQQIAEQEMLPVKGKPGMYKINYVEELITQEGIDEFYPIEDYKDVIDYNKLQEGGGIQIPEDFKENQVVKFKDDTGERLGRLVDIFDNSKAIVEVSTGETEVDLYSLKVPSKLTRAQAKIAEGVFPEEKIEKEFELTTDFMEKKGIKPEPKPEVIKRPTSVAPKRNIKSRIFDTVKIFTGKSDTLPTLQSIAIKGSKIMATDLEVGIIYESGKDIGNLTLDPKDLKGKSIEEIEINEKEGTAQIGAVRVRGESVEDFPLIPEVKIEPQLQIGAENLIDGFNKTVGLIEKSTTRPEIGSLFIKNEKGQLRFTSTDSFRIYQFYSLAKISKNFEALIPKASAEKISRIIKQTKPGLVSIAVDSKNKQIQFEFDNFKVVSRLVEGEYPDYKPIIPTTMTNQVTVDREKLLALLNESPTTKANRVELKLDEKNNKITFSVEDKLKGISFTKEIGVTFAKKPAKVSVDENLYVVMPIKDGEISFNIDYLKDFLKTSKANEIEMSNITKEAPLVLRETSDSFTDFVRETSEEYGQKALEQIKKKPTWRKSNIRLKLKEIGRFYTKDLLIESPNDVADIFSELKKESREKVFILNLTKDNKIINVGLVSIGGINAALVSPAEILKPVLASKAKKIFFIHNHPSAEVTPSVDDVTVMTKLKLILEKVGVEFEGGVIINYDQYGFVSKNLKGEVVHYTPIVKKGEEISIVEMEQIINNRELFLKDGNVIRHPEWAAKFFSGTINPDVPVVAVINLSSKSNVIGYEIVGSSFENTNALIKKISASVARNNPAHMILVSNIPFNKVIEEKVLEIKRFTELLDAPVLDVVSVKKDGTYKSYQIQGGLRASNIGVSENIANYDEFSAEEKAVIKAIQEGAPVPIDLAEAVKSLQERGVIQTTKKKERVRKEKVPKPPREFLKVGERESQRGITISHSSIVAKRPYLISYKVGEKRVVRSFETYEDAKRRFDIMVEIRSKGFLKRGELPKEIQSTMQQKGEAHMIANRKRITPRQYKKLALAYTGVDSMTKMTPEQAQEFIAALKAIKPTFAGRITIPKSKELVTQEEAETKFRDIKFGWLLDIFRTPANVFRRIGVERQAAPIFKGFELRRDFTNKWFAKFKQWQKELDVRGIFFKKKKMAEQSKRLFRAINNPEETVELSEKEALIVTRGRMVAEEVANLVDDARAEVGLEPMNRRQDYITNLLTELSHFILQQTKQAPNEVYALLDLRIPSSIFDRLLLERKGGLPIKEDFWAAMKAMVQVHGKYIHLNPPVHRFERFMRFYGDKVPQLSRWYIRSRINRFLNRPSKIEVWLRKVDEAITQTISKIPGLHKSVEMEWQNGVTEVIEIPRIVSKVAQKGLRTLKSVRYAYDLAFSVSFYTINLTQFWLNTVPKLRGNVLNIYQSAFSGYAQMMVDFFRPSRWAYWRERGVLTEIDNVIDQEYGMGRGGANILNLFAKLSEFNNRVASALAAEKNIQLLAKKGKFEALYKELNSSFGEEAEEYARHISDMTQFRYGVEEKPIFFDNPITDLYYQYNTFALKQIEFTEQLARNLEVRGILKDFREAHREGKTKEFVANLTQGQRGEFIRFVINAFILSLLLGTGYVWEAIFKGMVPNQVEGGWKVLKGYWTGDRKLRQQGYRQVLLPPSWDLIEKVADYGIIATIKNSKAVKQLDLLRISITGEGELKTIAGKKKEEITRGVAVTRLFKSYREKTGLINSKGWDLYLGLSRKYDNTREKAIELIKKGEKQKARELARDYNKEAKEDLEKLKELEVTDLRLQENIKKAKKAKIVSVADFNRWKEAAKD